MGKYTSKKSGSSSAWIWAIFVIILVAVPIWIWQKGTGNIEKIDCERAVQIERYDFPVALGDLEHKREFGSKAEASEAAKKLAGVEAEYAGIVARNPQWGKGPSLR